MKPSFDIYDCPEYQNHFQQMFWFSLNDQGEINSFHLRLKDKQISVYHSFSKRTVLYSVRDNDIFEEKIFDHCMTIDQVLMLASAEARQSLRHN